MTAVYNQPIQYAINGATAIPATKFARRVEMWEDGSVNAVGIIVTYPNGSSIAYEPARQPVVLGNTEGAGDNKGNLLGIPAQDGINSRAADNYCTVTPMSGTTKLNVIEYD